MRRTAWILAAVSLIGTPGGFALTEEEENEIRGEAKNFRYNTVTKDGLTFRVPEDMPVEKRDGILAPIPFDEYMYGKFKQMDTRLKTIEETLDRIETLLKEGNIAQRKALRTKPAEGS